MVCLIAANHQCNSDNMMCHHLPVVFPARLSVEDENLVQVERSLKEIVEFDRSSDGYVGIIYPDVYRV